MPADTTTTGQTPTTAPGRYIGDFDSHLRVWATPGLVTTDSLGSWHTRGSGIGRVIVRDYTGQETPAVGHIPPDNPSVHWNGTAYVEGVPYTTEQFLKTHTAFRVDCYGFRDRTARVTFTKDGECVVFVIPCAYGSFPEHRPMVLGDLKKYLAMWPEHGQRLAELIGERAVTRLMEAL